MRDEVETTLLHELRELTNFDLHTLRISTLRLRERYEVYKIIFRLKKQIKSCCLLVIVDIFTHVGLLGEKL